MIETLLSEAIINRHLREETPDTTASSPLLASRSLAAFQNVCLSLRLMSDPFKITAFRPGVRSGGEVPCVQTAAQAVIQ